MNGGVTVTARRLSRRGRKQVVCAGAGVALAVLAGVALPAAAGAASAKPDAVAGVKLSAGPLGIDVAPWTNPATLTALRSQLEAAHVTQIHYGGGTTADEYDWENDTDISNCKTMSAADYSAACATQNVDALKFSTFSQEARAIGAQSMVTANFGTGQVGWASDWVKQATTTPGQAIADYEIGNENYGCWEPNDYIPGFQPNVPADCPMNANLDAGMQELANSYATNAATIMAAMKAQNANAQLVVPYANDGTVGGASVADNTDWNNIVIGGDAQYIGAVDEHWYDFGFGCANTTGPVCNAGEDGNPSAQAVIQSVETIPAQDAKIEQSLSANGDPNAKVIVGETGVSYKDTNVPCTPAGALFAAGDVLEWLSSGAVSVDWWPLNTDSNIHYTTSDCRPDEAMFTNPPTGTPQPLSPYTGYLLASQLAQPNATLGTLATGNGQVLGFQSALPNGQVAVALINTNTTDAERVTVSTSLTGNLSTETYSAGNQNAGNTKTVSGATSASAFGGGVTLPRESILVLKTLRPSAMALTSTAASYKAGTKVTLKGKLTLNGATTPAGDTVKITRKRSGTPADAATLTAKTVAGGAFTVTDVPPATGTYVYDASFSSSNYDPSSHSVTVKVTAAKPNLRLAVSAKTVKPGKHVTVTATLGAPHANRTLSIYAQIKGGGRKLMKRATINSKGQLSIVYTIRVDTTFTVTFTGDTWYTSASAAATVKS
jgi:hypothetical protein